MSDPTDDLAAVIRSAIDEFRHEFRRTISYDLSHGVIPETGARAMDDFVADAVLASGLVSVNPPCETCGGTGTVDRDIPPHVHVDTVGYPQEPCPAGCVNGRTPTPSYEQIGWLWHADNPLTDDPEAVSEGWVAVGPISRPYWGDERDVPVYRRVGGDR